jgi:hypothetical protein
LDICHVLVRSCRPADRLARIQHYFFIDEDAFSPTTAARFDDVARAEEARPRTLATVDLRMYVLVKLSGH